MTDKRIIAKQCSRCGAPLVQHRNELICEYCKTSYSLPQEYFDHSTDVEKEDNFSKPPTDPINTSQQSTINSPQFQQKTRKTPVVFILVVIIGITIFLCLTLMGFWKKDKVSTSDPNQETELQMYRMNSSAMPDEYPADFVHNQQLSIGVILKTISYTDFSINIFAENELDRTISANLKSDQMIISTVNMKDSLGNQYSCEINNEFTESYQEMEPNDIARIGLLYCTPGFIPPEVKYIDMEVTFTNWGNYNFQIPLDLNFQELKIEYNLTRNDDSFEIEPEIYAAIPQYIAIKYDDISVIDDNGNYYPLEYCDDYATMGRESENYEYFIDMANHYSSGSFFHCHFSKPIPYEVNAITLVMNVRGNTVTNTFKMDTVK
jgi:hypothetical protein